MTSPSHLAGSRTATDEGSEGLLHLLGAVLDILHGHGERPNMGVRTIIGFHRAALAGIEVGNVFGNDDAFPSMNADHPWVKVGVVVASSFKAFNGALHCATVFGPSVGAVGE